MGEVGRRLQWQVVPWGVPLDPVSSPIEADAYVFTESTPTIRLLSLPATGRHIWRARIQYDPAQSPFVPHSPWFTISGNALREADLFSTSQAAPGPCAAPDEELYLYMVTLDVDGKPVLHFMDPKLPSAVSGYNVYRASSPMGPWILIGADVADQDLGVANKQYTDPTGNVGGCGTTGSRRSTQRAAPKGRGRADRACPNPTGRHPDNLSPASPEQVSTWVSIWVSITLGL